MSVSVKITVLRNSGRGGRHDKKFEDMETRRFSVDEGAATSYDYFRAKVVNVVPRLQDKAFRLYWKDNEGDLIAFSSDEELIEALGQLHRADNPGRPDGTGLFRVYVEDFSDSNSGNQRPSAAAASSGFRVPYQCYYNGSAPAIPPFMEFFLQMASTAAGAHGCGDANKQGAGCDGRFSWGGASAGGNPCTSQREEPPAAPASSSDRKDDSSASSGAAAAGMEFSSGSENANSNAGAFASDVISGLLGLLSAAAGQNSGQHSQGSSSTSTGSEQRERTSSSQGEDSSTNGDANDASNTGSGSEPSPLSDRLLQVVETLKEMGIRDDNGWLTRLVASHSGQVEQLVEFAQNCCATTAASASSCNC